MEIRIKALGGSIFPYEINAESTPLNIKQYLETTQGFPLSEQILICDHKPLEDKKKIMDFYSDELIKTNNVISFLLNLKGGMQIFVKLVTGKTITVDVDADDEILTLKKKVSEKTGQNPDEFLLFYGSKELNDPEQRNLKIKDFDIPKEATVMLVYRMRGGNENYY